MRLSHCRPFVALCCLCIGASEACAHSPIKGLGTFYSHFLDPVVAPAHALLLVAAALMLGLQGRTIARLGLAALIVGFAVGLLLAVLRAHSYGVEQAILAAAVAAGAAVSLDRRVPKALAVAAATIAGLLIGLDCDVDGAGARESWLILAGLFAGVAYFGTVIAGTVVLQTRPVARIGLRIVGSWIVAAAVMVLALNVAQQAKRAPSASAQEIRRATPC